MTPPTTRDATLALCAARRAVPALQIVLRPLDGPEAWTLDRCCSTIHISTRLTPNQHAEALIDALAVLISTIRPRTAAATIPAPRTYVIDDTMRLR